MIEIFKQNKTKKDIEKIMEEALEKDATICLTKKGAETNIKLSGNFLAILIALAALEKSILKKYGVDEENFEFIKNVIGQKEKKDE